LGQYEKSLADYQKAISLDPNLPWAYRGIGIIYQQKGQFDGAIEQYTKAISLDPNFAEAYFSRGLIYQIKGDKRKAQIDLNTACVLGFKVACK
jgi:tetratricopeptide (TPR) repeat protein